MIERNSGRVLPARGNDTQVARVPARVVIVDDETGHRERGLELKGSNFIVTEAFASVEEFLQIGPDIDIVLLDLWIRVGGQPLRGLEAVRQIRARGYRVLLHSMDERRNVLAALGGAGANGFVSKASSTADLIAAIEAVAEGKDVLLTIELAGLADELSHLGAIQLTARESEVLRARARGMSLKATASATHYSQKSVEAAITSLNRKFGAFLQEYGRGSDQSTASQPSVYAIARALGYGPRDLLEPPP